MRRYVAEDTELETLRQALIEAENSGQPKRWNLDSFLAERRRKR
jgi:Arc/MetJ-type ribon-helix-helix transcriptional regulator